MVFDMNSFALTGGLSTLADTAEVVSFTVNGKKVNVNAGHYPTLLLALRESLHLTGTKYGCGEGQCGACTVLIDGKVERSCSVATASVVNQSVVTIEGLGSDDALHPVQQAFIDEGAMQCGYCSSGMVLAIVAMLMENPKPSDSEIVDAMNGNICRCCNYTRIHAAIQRVIKA
jgi:aerobic-type carbon monoxide dehydrogenase small subunit (CoxS/CutS family)